MQCPCDRIYGNLLSPTSLADVSTSWKIFTSKTEGFTIRFPDNWTVKDNSLINCGHKTGMATPHGYCRDSFNFISPDGLTVRYVIYNDENNDRIECGCATRRVDGMDGKSHRLYR